jgi:hypothetical protein
MIRLRELSDLDRKSGFIHCNALLYPAVNVRELLAWLRSQRNGS